MNHENKGIRHLRLVPPLIELVEPIITDPEELAAQQVPELPVQPTAQLPSSTSHYSSSEEHDRQQDLSQRLSDQRNPHFD